MSYICLLERGEEFSAGSFLDIAASVRSRSMRIAGRCYCKGNGMECCHGSPSGTTSPPSTHDLGGAGWTWWQAVSLARTSASRERVPGSTGNAADSGERWPEWFAKWDRATSSWRTPQLSLLAGLDEFSATWPRWGMMRTGVCWEPTTAVPRIDAKESGFWPTPSAQEAGVMDHLETKDGKKAKLGQRAYNPKTGKHVQVTLNRAVRMWNTPTADDALNRKKGKYNSAGVPKLSAEVKLFPTPAAQDAKNSTLPPSQKDRDSIPGHLLRNGEAPGGQLNPEWVEWLMGWPIGWTGLEPLGMDRWREWHRQHGGSFTPAPSEKRETTNLETISNSLA